MFVANGKNNLLEFAEDAGIIRICHYYQIQILVAMDG